MSTEGDKTEPAAIDYAMRATYERLALLSRSGTFLTGAAIVVFWVACAIFGPYLVPHNPFAIDLATQMQPPSGEHWFGTDSLGRDIFSRVIVGARDILSVAPRATLLGTVFGTALGLVMGYFGGAIDEVISRVVDAFRALPLVITALLALVALGSSATTVVVVIAIVFTPIIARTVRAAVLGERHLDYIAAAELRGESALYIMFVEILPNILPPILVEATVRFGYAIFTVATLSFLGFGIRPPSPDWGLTIAQNYPSLIGGYWWMVAFNAMAIASLIVGVNLITDGIQAVVES